MSRLRTLFGSRWLRAGLLVALAGWAPLLLYVAWEHATGATGGNPIGLGLLMVASTPVALGLVFAGLVQGVVRTVRGAHPPLG